MASMTVTSGDLFHIAAATLGDPMQWINIALTNQMSDPFIDQLLRLIIPPSSPAFSGGIAPQ